MKTDIQEEIAQIIIKQFLFYEQVINKEKQSEKIWLVKIWS